MTSSSKLNDAQREAVHFGGDAGADPGQGTPESRQTADDLAARMRAMWR